MRKSLLRLLPWIVTAGLLLWLFHRIDLDKFRDGIHHAAGWMVPAVLACVVAVYLADSLAIAKAAGVAAQTKLLDAPGKRLGDSVAEAARAWEADLIVVGTHGRRGIGRVLLGSGAEQIIRLSPVPVLVIRADEKPSA